MIFDRAFKKILTLSSKAVTNMINGLCMLLRAIKTAASMAYGFSYRKPHTIKAAAYFILFYFPR